MAGACSGYLVEHDGTRILLDCGSGVAGSVQRACPLGKIDHVFVSHYHYDHVSDAGALMFARLVQRKVGEELGDITFYALGGSEQFEPDFSRLSMEGASRAVAIDEGSRVDLGGLSLEFMRTSHPVSCLAARVRAADGATLVYTADGALTEGLVDFCRGADALICECSLYEGYDGSVMGHMSCEDVTALANAARPGTLVLSHLPIYGDVERLRRWVVGHLEEGATGEVLLASDAPKDGGLPSLEVRPRVAADLRGDGGTRPSQSSEGAPAGEGACHGRA